MTNDFFYPEDERIGKRVEKKKNHKRKKKWRFHRIPCSLPRGVVKMVRKLSKKILKHDAARSCSN